MLRLVKAYSAASGSCSLQLLLLATSNSSYELLLPEVIWSHLFPSQDPRWSHPRKSIVLVKNPGGLLQGSRGAGGRGQGLRDLRASEKWQMRRWGRLDNATQESRKCSKEPSNNQEDRKSAAISGAAEAWFATNSFLKMCTSLRPNAHFYAFG